MKASGSGRDEPGVATAWDLGELAEATACHGPIALQDESTDELLAWLASMHRVRLAEEAIGDLVRAGEVRCPCHLAIGQEGCAVGVAAALRATDRAFGAHRSHGHYLAMGGQEAGQEGREEARQAGQEIGRAHV